MNKAVVVPMRICDGRYSELNIFSPKSEKVPGIFRIKSKVEGLLYIYFSPSILYTCSCE
jgi:hypothetical protein